MPCTMKKFYFTFGFGHRLLNGQSATNCYTTIEAENEMKAREIMYWHYNNKWSMCYFSAEEAGVYTYNLKYVTLGD